MEAAWQSLDLNDAGSRAAWDAVCLERPEPSAFHSAAWGRAIARTYGADCRSVRSGSALFPLFGVRTLSGKRRLVSVPYAPYGGMLPLPEDRTAAPPMPMPDGACVAVRQVEMAVADTQALTEADRVTMWLDLPSAPEALWKSLNAKVRNQVRKAEKEGVTATAGREEHLAAFYRLYARRMHELGTPAHPPAFFKALLEEFPEAEFLVAEHQGQPVGTVFDIGWGGWRVNLYGATLFEKRSLCANNLVYWKSLERGCTGGRRYDFGRSLFGSGQYEFKRQWGALPHRVAERRFLRENGAWREAADAVEAVNPLLPRIWQRLPAPVASWLSGRLRKHVF